MRGFVAGESWAYEAAYRIYATTLHAAAASVLRDKQEAQDCVHDVMLRLWRGPNAFTPERGSLRAFLAVCVRNEALSRLRKSRNRARIEQTLPQHDDQHDDLGAGVAQRESIRHAIESLTDKQRQAVALAYFKHFTHDEIAQTLNEPVGTVKSRLSTALRRLREVFDAQETADVRSE